MSYNNYGNCGNNYGGSCGNNNSSRDQDDNEGIRGILSKICIGNRIRVHFDSTSHTGRYLGIQNGSVLIIDNNIPVYIPVRKVLAIDLVGH